MTVSARVVGEVGVAARVAHGGVSAEAASPTGQYVSRRLGLVLVQVQPAHVIAQHVGDPGGGVYAAGHGLRRGRLQGVERARDFGEPGLGEVRVHGGGAEAAVAEQTLDHT